MKNNRVRLNNVVLDGEYEEAFQELLKKLGTKAKVIKKSIAIAHFLMKEQEANGRLLVENADKTIDELEWEF